MGVIYSTSEVFGERMPERHDHNRAGALVLELFETVPAVSTVLVHGSVAEGQYTRRSDLDALILYDDEGSLKLRAEIVPGIKEKLEKITVETRVKVEANIWPLSDPLSAIQARMYDRLFSQHLVESFLDPKWVRGEVDGRVVEIAKTCFGIEEVRKIVMDYVVYKADGFTNASYVFDEADPRCMSMLQRGFELPRSTGRKVAQFIAELKGLPAPKNFLEELAKHSSLLDREANGALNQLILLDGEYTAMLEEIAHRGEMTQNEYRQWLSDAYARTRRYGIIATGGFAKFVDSFGR